MKNRGKNKYRGKFRFYLDSLIHATFKQEVNMMKKNTSNLRIYGPQLPRAIECLTKLSDRLASEGELPIKGGNISMGKYDFQFIWSEDPKPARLLNLVEEIDKCLTGLPTKYSITTIGEKTNRLTAEIDRRALNTIFSFIRIHGPSISKALRAIEEAIEEIEPTNTLESLKSSVLVGEYDYCFEWDHWPSFGEIHAVLKSIDQKVEPTGALYTITTKRNVYRTDKVIDDHSSDNLMAFL